ncbi:MAG: LEA type 2 family protein [Tenacibaculum sp.]|nr:LEA type 2 family protein [Tenacibaculum sp.]
MKKILSILVITLIIVGCSVKKKPTFIKVDGIKVLSFKNDTVKLQAKAYFKNENDIGGKISTDEVKVFVNKVEVAKVSSKEFEVPANKEFHVPLLVNIPSKSILKSNGLEGLIKSVLKRSVQVEFKGDIKYKVLGFSSTYSIDETKEVKY